MQFEKIGSTFLDVFGWETHHVWAPRNFWKFIEQDRFYVDRSPAFLTSDDFIRSNEIIRTKWPIYVVIGHFVLTI